MISNNKKIILYGINRFQSKIQKLLSDDYFVCGYSDSDEKYKNIKTYEYKPFYTPQNLLNAEFDYIIICSSNKKESESILLSLRKSGIDENKIIQTYCLAWDERMFRTTFDDFLMLNQNFEGLVFGMSYSRFAFLTHFFDKNFFKFSLGGVDLYTNKKWISYLIENKKELLNSVKYIVFDLPYYIFNWDITSTSQIYYRMAYFDRFDDYRKFGENPSGQKYIRNYRTLKDMFAEKFEPNKSVFANNLPENGEMLKKAEDDSYYAASGIWYKRYEDTIRENIQIFYDILNIIKDYNPEIKIAAVVYPYCQRFMDINTEYIEKLQKEFYEIVSNAYWGGIELFDFIRDEPYFNDSCFRDATHFNSKGAEMFSKILNEKFKEKFYC